MLEAMRGRRGTSTRMDPVARLASLSTAERRGLERMLLFVGTFPAEAFAALSGPSAALVERDVLVAQPSGLAIEPGLRALLVASSKLPETKRGSLVLHGRWLVEHLAKLEQSSDFVPALLDRMEPLVADVRWSFERLAPIEPALAASAWSAIGELLFYRRLLPFDVPEYGAAVLCADASGDASLRVRTRLLAGRAALELPDRERAAEAFEQATRLAHEEGLSELEGDAIRGLGWSALAGGQFEIAEDEFQKARAVHEDVGSSRGLADACMAQAVVRRLRGDGDDAARLLFRAEALLLARRDAVRLAKLADLRATLGLAVVPLDPDDVQRKVRELLAAAQYWRAALLLARLPDAASREQARILADLAHVPMAAFERSLVEVGGEPSALLWVLSVAGRRRLLRAPDGTTHDLTRSGPMLRVLEALASAREPKGPSEIFAAAWPGERADHQSALHRVYTTIRRLRALGLPTRLRAPRERGRQQPHAR